jgi:glutamyl-tRNA synthetase
LESLKATLQTVSPFTHDALEPAFQSVLEEHELKMGKLAQPVRVALTGGTASPGIYEVMELLGQEKTCARLAKAVTLISDTTVSA